MPISFYGQKQQFGQITITPTVSDKATLDRTGLKLLQNKLNQIVTKNEVAGGFDRRFIITSTINILSENTSASIPQKTSMKVDFTFYVGDGIDGNLFGTSSIEATGVGDNHYSALYSAIRKIDASDGRLQSLINESKIRIVKYYNTIAPMLITDAKEQIKIGDFETALSKLSVIPSSCEKYKEARTLISECGAKLIEKENKALLVNAKTAWSSSPNKEGAEAAKKFISGIRITSSAMQKEVNELNDQIRKRLIQIEDKEMELEQARIISQENIEKEQIAASAKVTSSFFNSLPNLIYNIFKWF